MAKVELKRPVPLVSPGASPLRHLPEPRPLPPAIRLAAMMQIRTTFVMTHDSIGLGEDGPTHQPVEQLAALRAIPHLAVYRPGDAVETAECWENILDTPRRAALLALSRQPMPLLQRESGTQNKSSRGAYILLEAEGGPRRLTLMATGSELHLAVEAREVLQKEGIPTIVVSMPCRCCSRSRTSPTSGPSWVTHARVAVEGGGRTRLGALSRLPGPLRWDARLRRVRQDPTSTRSSTSRPTPWFVGG